MVSLLLPLSGDVETHGTVLGGGPAYLAIDEDPSDGDATRVRILNAGETEASSIDAAALPLQVAISAVRVVWDAGGTGIEPALARAGLRIGGTDYWAPARVLSPNAYGGSYTESWTTNPAASAPWSRDAVAALVPVWQTTFQPVELGWPRLTQRIVYVDYVQAGVRVEAEGDAQPVVAAGTAVNGCVATAAPGGPTATAASLSAAATAAPASPDAEGD